MRCFKRIITACCAVIRRSVSRRPKPFSVGAFSGEADPPVKLGGYQLRKVSANHDPFSLLNGLAMVSAVTRSRVLADEVRILSRGALRRPGTRLTPEAIARIALVAAAANNELPAWSKFLGDWLAELAFAEMTRE